MSRLAALEFFIQRKEDFVNYSNKNDFFQQDIKNINLLKHLFSGFVQQHKTLENKSFKVDLLFTPCLVSCKGNEKEYQGSLVYICRRKSDNHLVSGLYSDLQNHSNNLTNGGIDLILNPPANRLTIESDFKLLDIDSFMEELDANYILNIFKNTERRVDSYEEAGLLREAAVVTLPFEVLYSKERVLNASEVPRDGYTNQSRHFKYQANQFSETGELDNISKNLSELIMSPLSLLEIGAIDADDVKFFSAKMTKAIMDEFNYVVNDFFAKALSYGLPEQIKPDEIINHKYTTSELNFIRSRPSDHDDRCSFFRYQYIEKMRSYFGVANWANSGSVVEKLESAKAKYISHPHQDYRNRCDWALHTMLMVNQKEGNQLNSISDEKVQLINRGVLPVSMFTQEIGLAFVQKHTFDSIMKQMASGVYHKELLELGLLGALPKDVHDFDEIYNQRDLLMRDGYMQMYQEINRQLINFSASMQELRLRHQREDSYETKRDLKSHMSKYAWLNKGGNKLSSYNALLNKYSGQELHHFGLILHSYLEAVVYRLAFDASPEPNKIFTVDLSSGQTECVNLDVQALGDQLITDSSNSRLTQENIRKIVSSDFGSALAKQFINTSDDYRGLLELNRKAHTTKTKNTRRLVEFNHEDFGWTPLFEGNVPIGGGFYAEVINTKSRLFDEELTQEHCVSSYLNLASAGHSFILSITDEKLNRVSTVELINDSLGRLQVKQNYGFRNKAVPKDVADTVDAFVSVLNTDADSIGVDLCKDVVRDIDVERAKISPADYASCLKLIDFNSEAAHMCCFTLEDALGGKFSINEILNFIGWSDLYASSRLGLEITSIKNVVNHFSDAGITPYEVIALNAEKSFGFDEVLLMKELTNIYKPEKAVVTIDSIIDDEVSAELQNRHTSDSEPPAVELDVNTMTKAKISNRRL